jgi:hypothetical protein
VNTRQLLYLAGSAAIGIALAGLLPRGPSAASPLRDRVTMGLLAGVIVALMIVGVVSGTLRRHVVQVTPLALAILLVALRSPYGAAAALPLFTFWLGIMVNIWLFLLGILQIFGGRFTGAEIALTIAMAVLSAGGIATAWRRSTPLPRATRLATSGVFAVLQVGALIVSMQAGRG